MDSHNYPDSLQHYDAILAAGAWKWIASAPGNAFAKLRAFTHDNSDWLFGHVGFGMQSEIFPDLPVQPDPVGFPHLGFFVPEHLLLLKGDVLRVSSHSQNPDSIVAALTKSTADKPAGHQVIRLIPAVPKADYVRTIGELRAHIRRGDCYEINFCQEFSASETVIDPVQVFREMSNVSPNPFSVFYKSDETYLLCASPERFFTLQGESVWSQPIKGTAPRFPDDPVRDEDQSRRLLASAKEKAENVMIVDLVRNDLSRVCRPGSVTVTELFGIHAFPQVFQMISTVSGELSGGRNWIDVLENCFPMGSMTGAPKKRVLELIARYEKTGRGIFSGTVGYVDPDGNADFNVVIRSILYSNTRRQLSCLVGSGITWYADAEQEYEECLLKVQALLKILEGSKR
ncbi:anthranilate synthase component I family protein [Flavihumibacter petaseus]|nr:anthranilate synthase component I family protein [Flavihumibacter petaseus]